jgi:hypothetical protein
MMKKIDELLIDELIKNLIEAVSEINKPLGFASAYYYRNKDVEKCKEALMAEFTGLHEKIVNADSYGSCMKNERDSYRSWYQMEIEQLKAEKEKCKDNYWWVAENEMLRGDIEKQKAEKVESKQAYEDLFELYHAAHENENKNYRLYLEAKDKLEDKKTEKVLTTCKCPIEIRIIYPCESQDND